MSQARQLEDVNFEVNKFKYVADPTKYNLPDFWTAIGPGGGDCDDYAVGKLRRLVALGWPIENLHLACCYCEEGSYHCVLVVAADDADYVLDNRFKLPYTVDQLKKIQYVPDVIQAVGGSPEWVEWLYSE